MPDGNRSEKLSSLGVITAIVLGLYLSSLYSYLLFHSLIEIITIAVAFTLFILTWNTRGYLGNGYLRLLGISYAFIALIDLLHTLAYKGMNVFPGYGANLPTQLWIAARYLQAITLLAAPLFAERGVNNGAIIGIYAAAVSALVAMVYSGNFPDCFIEGKGLTAFKIGSEYVISAILLASLYLFYRKRKYFDEKVFFLAASSIACTVLSEISFTAYVSVYGFANLVGHFAKLTAFYLIYRAILVTGLKEPFDLIFRDLKQAEEALRKARDTLDAKVRERTAELRASEERYRSLIRKVRTAIVLHDGQGRILSSNPLAQDLLGLTEDQLLGKALIDPEWHFLREDGSVMPVAEYPVSLVLSSRQPLRSYMTGVSRPDRDDVAWMLVNAEPEYDDAGEIAQVIVSFVDITERRRVQDVLRINEGRYRKAQAMGHVGNWEYDLQTSHFWGSDEAKRIYGFDPEKADFSTDEVENCIPERERVHQALVDLIETGKEYNLEFEIHPRNSPEPRIIASIAELQRNEHGEPVKIVGVIQDITERKRAEDALRRLNRELRAISACNQVLVRAEDEQILLNNICRIICDDAGYRMAWVGYVEHDEEKNIRPVAWAGAEDGYLANANITWADTERGRGPSGTAIRRGESASIQDFMTAPQAAPWRENALRRGYRSSIALPLKDKKTKAFGALNIYSVEPNAFTPNEIRLMGELAGDLAFGIVVLRERVERKRAEDELYKLNEELEERVKDRTAELEQKNRELERLNRVFAGRELRMAELKERIRELEGKLK